MAKQKQNEYVELSLQINALRAKRKALPRDVQREGRTLLQEAKVQEALLKLLTKGGDKDVIRQRIENALAKLV